MAIDAPAAGSYYKQRGVTTSQSDRPVAGRLALGKRIKVGVIHRIPAGRFFHRVGSEVFDFDEPPFFKQFLRIDADSKQITVSCFGVSGCAGTEHVPTIEDHFTLAL